VHSEVRCWTFNLAGYDYGYLNARTIKVKQIMYILSELEEIKDLNSNIDNDLIHNYHSCSTKCKIGL
jgi:hypothetical protein